MGKRHSNAIAIQEGACNPTAIARSIVEACKELQEEDTNAVRNDPALRLMVHQLAFLMNTSELDNSINAYSELVAECKKQEIVITELKQAV